MHLVTPTARPTLNIHEKIVLLNHAGNVRNTCVIISLEPGPSIVAIYLKRRIGQGIESVDSKFFSAFNGANAKKTIHLILEFTCCHPPALMPYLFELELNSLTRKSRASKSTRNPQFPISSKN